MTRLLGWLKSTTARVLDPQRDLRIASLADDVWRQLSEQGRGFAFRATMSGLGADVEDNELVAERVYGKALGKAWADRVVTERERQSLDFIAKALMLRPERLREIERRQGLAVFEAALGEAMADGHLEPFEVQVLSQIASGLNTTIGALMLQCFAEKGEALLRSAFAGAMQSDAFTLHDWQRLVATAAGLGLTEEELRQAVAQQARVYVEHVLADIKSDGRITPAERQSVQWMLSTFGMDADFAAYVWGEIQTIDTYSNIAAGRLPSMQVGGVALRAGEIAHRQCPAMYVQVKQTKAGTRAVRHDGYATITDTRVIFSSPTKSFDLNLRRVVSLLPVHGGGIEVRAGTGGGQYYFYGDPALATAIFETAVGKANQTIVERLDGASTRHITREVRQRVWQQYGGRCADCGATQYLEFDHIVPRAKGGSNAKANVQLLCRGCNSRKSDSI